MSPRFKKSSTASTDQADDPSYYFFLSPDAAYHLARYKYHGEDRSYLYKYVLSPLATYMVENHTPTWLAPNTITLIGLLFMLLGYAFFAYYTPAFGHLDQIPSWLFIYNACATLIYQTLDNMDGKQARKTGSSSSLGLFFDHGCDAVNAVLCAAAFLCTVGLDPQQDYALATAALMQPCVVFYVSTWEEYYTGKLIMPVVNGPSEGLAACAALSWLSALWGPQIWHTRPTWTKSLVHWIARQDIPLCASLSGLFPHGLRSVEIVIVITWIFTTMDILHKVFSMMRRYGVQAFQNLLPLITLFACFGLVDANVWLRAPRASLHLQGILFVEMTTDLMLCHVTKQLYSPMRWILMPLVLFAGWQCFGSPMDPVVSDTLLIVYATAVTTYFLCKATVLIREICHALNIWCFDIVTPRMVDKLKDN